MGICFQDEIFHQENILLLGCFCLLALTSATCWPILKCKAMLSSTGFILFFLDQLTTVLRYMVFTGILSPCSIAAVAWCLYIMLKCATLQELPLVKAKQRVREESWLRGHVSPCYRRCRYCWISGSAPGWAFKLSGKQNRESVRTQQILTGGTDK